MLHNLSKDVALWGVAAALAAVLSGKIEAQDRTIVALATGGNVDRAMFARALERL